jgi:hypothetical protein
MRAAAADVNHPRCFVSLGTLALAVALPLTGCGNYDPEPRAGAGGTTMTAGGQLNTAGQTATGAAAGSAGQTAMGGSSATGGSGPLTVTPVEADCEAVVPCGGSVVGTWVVAGSCLPVSGNADIAGFGLGCIAAPVTGTLEVTGTWIANDDGTFSDQTTTTGSSQIELPAACLNVSGTVTTCDRLGGALQALGYSDVTCADAASGGGCSCSASVQQAGGLALVTLGAASRGTYTTANNVVTTTAAGSNKAYSYCASGNTLVVTPQASGTTGALTGTIVLAKP